MYSLRVQTNTLGEISKGESGAAAVYWARAVNAVAVTCAYSSTNVAILLQF